jgi:hypothetical protein
VSVQCARCGDYCGQRYGHSDGYVREISGRTEVLCSNCLHAALDWLLIELDRRGGRSKLIVRPLIVLDVA